MIPARSFNGKKVALFGLGGSGLATARALVEGGAEVLAWDDNPDSVAKAEQEGITVGDLRQGDWSGFSSLVLSPGVPLTHPKPHWTVELARGAGVEIIGDVELFARERTASARRARRSSPSPAPTASRRPRRSPPTSSRRPAATRRWAAISAAP